MTATSGAAGRAVVQYRVKPKDPTGQYQVKADATLNGITGNNTATFMVAK